MKTISSLFITLMILSVIFFTAPVSAGNECGVQSLKILYNGKVFTGDSNNKWAQAIAIYDRFIVAVGDNDTVLGLAGEGAEVIDLQGNLVIPGINDAHMHILPLNVNGDMLNHSSALLGPGPSFEELNQMVAQATQQQPAGSWLYVAIGDVLSDNPQIHRTYLDQLAPNHPLALFYMHTLIMNTAAMQELGISETQPDPLGGVYERYPGTQIINGRMHEYALYDFVRRATMPVPVNQLRQFYGHYIDTAVSLGVTSTQDLPIGVTHAKAYEVLNGMDLKMRVRLINIPFSREEAENTPYTFRLRPFWSKLTTSGTKWFLDGTVLERNGYVFQPYVDRPGWYGMFNFDFNVLDLFLSDGLRGPRSLRQLLFHTFGDKASENLLAGMTRTTTDRKWKKRRLQLIHGDMITADQIPLIKNKGVVVVQNPNHLALPQVMFNRYGPERMATLQPIKSLLDNDVHLAFGSDGIGEVISPYVDIMFAVIHPTRPSEGITVEQALIAFTQGSAYAEYKEHVKGKIKFGMLADIAVLSQDIFNIPPTQLPATYSLLTIVDGQVVFDTGVLTSN